MSDKLYATAEDLAAANVSSMLCQFFLDTMIQHKLTTSADAADLLEQMARFHEMPGDPRRQNVRKVTSSLLRLIKTKYAEPTESAH